MASAKIPIPRVRFGVWAQLLLNSKAFPHTWGKVRSGPCVHPANKKIIKYKKNTKHKMGVVPRVRSWVSPRQKNKKKHIKLYKNRITRLKDIGSG
jgi:hypothetical protein